jgi:hypothetical protein
MLRAPPKKRGGRKSTPRANFLMRLRRVEPGGAAREAVCCSACKTGLILPSPVAFSRRLFFF